MLVWPEEMALPGREDIPKWCHTGSNLCLDFHGDPLTAKLVENIHKDILRGLMWF